MDGAAAPGIDPAVLAWIAGLAGHASAHVVARLEPELGPIVQDALTQCVPLPDAPATATAAAPTPTPYLNRCATLSRWSAALTPSRDVLPAVYLAILALHQIEHAAAAVAATASATATAAAQGTAPSAPPASAHATSDEVVAAATTLYAWLETLITTFDPAPVSAAPALVSEWYQHMDHVAQHVLQQPARALGPLVSACRRWSGGGRLTAAHPRATRIALSYPDGMDAVLPVLDAEITQIAPELDAIDIDDYLLYMYYGALVYTARQQWQRAYRFLYHVVTAPALDAVSQIQIDAYKRLLLVALIAHGRMPPLSRFTSPAVHVACRSSAAVYIEYVSAFLRAPTTLDRLVAFAAAQPYFRSDDTLALAQWTLTAQLHRNIQQLPETYVTMTPWTFVQAIDIPAANEDSAKAALAQRRAAAATSAASAGIGAGLGAPGSGALSGPPTAATTAGGSSAREPAGRGHGHGIGPSDSARPRGRMSVDLSALILQPSARLAASHDDLPATPGGASQANLFSHGITESLMNELGGAFNSMATPGEDTPVSHPSDLAIDVDGTSTAAAAVGAPPIPLESSEPSRSSGAATGAPVAEIPPFHALSRGRRRGPVASHVTAAAAATTSPFMDSDGNDNGTPAIPAREPCPRYPVPATPTITYHLPAAVAALIARHAHAWSARADGTPAPARPGPEDAAAADAARALAAAFLEALAAAGHVVAQLDTSCPGGKIVFQTAARDAATPTSVQLQAAAERCAAATTLLHAMDAAMQSAPTSLATLRLAGDGAGGLGAATLGAAGPGHGAALTPQAPAAAIRRRLLATSGGEMAFPAMDDSRGRRADFFAVSDHAGSSGSGSGSTAGPGHLHRGHGSASGAVGPAGAGRSGRRRDDGPRKIRFGRGLMVLTPRTRPSGDVRSRRDRIASSSVSASVLVSGSAAASATTVAPSADLSAAAHRAAASDPQDDVDVDADVDADADADVDMNERMDDDAAQQSDENASMDVL